MGRPPRSLLAALVAATIFGADQLSKHLVLAFLPRQGDAYTLIPGCLNLVHRRNPGIAFSLFHDWHAAPIFFAAFAIIVVLIIAFTLCRHPHLPRKIILALGLIAGGALGNLLDRLRPPHMVFDFIDCYLGTAHWPAFNLADSAICVGAGLLILASFTDPHAFSPSRSAP
ncbi:MAG: signal peptidase II [bacterium]|nr:signal peptidase II [bacterium]